MTEDKKMTPWVFKVESNQPITKKNIKLILIGATLGRTSSPDRSTLKIKLNDEEAFTFFTFVPGKLESYSLDYEVCVDGEVTISVDGPPRTTVELTGYTNENEQDAMHSECENVAQLQSDTGPADNVTLIDVVDVEEKGRLDAVADEMKKQNVDVTVCVCAEEPMSTISHPSDAMHSECENVAQLQSDTGPAESVTLIDAGDGDEKGRLDVVADEMMKQNVDVSAFAEEPISTISQPSDADAMDDNQKKRKMEARDDSNKKHMTEDKKKHKFDDVAENERKAKKRKSKERSRRRKSQARSQPN